MPALEPCLPLAPWLRARCQVRARVCVLLRLSSPLQVYVLPAKGMAELVGFEGSRGMRTSML